MNKGSIVERLCSDLNRKEPRYKSPTLLRLLYDYCPGSGSPRAWTTGKLTLTGKDPEARLQPVYRYGGSTVPWPDVRDATAYLCS